MAIGLAMGYILFMTIAGDILTSFMISILAIKLLPIVKGNKLK